MFEKIIILFIKIYQSTISKIMFYIFGDICCFSLSCSNYAIVAIGRFGVLKGGFLSAKRLLKCHSFSNYYFDPVPLELS